MQDLYNKLFIPFVAALCLTLLKKLAEGEAPSLNDANDAALDVIWVCLGAIAVLHAKGWTADQFASAIVLDIFLALLILTIRGVRTRNHATLEANDKPIPDVGYFAGLSELALGLAAIYVTVKDLKLPQ